MALVSVISFGVTDFAGARKSFPIYVPAATTLAQAQAWITAGAPILDALIDGKIDDVSITLTGTLPGGLKSSAVSGNTVREGALWAWDPAGTDFEYGDYMPSAANADFVGDVLDDTNTDVTDWIAQMTASGAGTEATDRYGNDIVSYIRGRRTFRK
jgi:hypothetical protein